WTGTVAICPSFQLASHLAQPSLGETSRHHQVSQTVHQRESTRQSRYQDDPQKKHQSLEGPRIDQVSQLPASSERRAVHGLIDSLQERLSQFCEGHLRLNAADVDCGDRLL